MHQHPAKNEIDAAGLMAERSGETLTAALGGNPMEEAMARVMNRITRNRQERYERAMKTPYDQNYYDKRPAKAAKKKRKRKAQKAARRANR